MTASLGDMLRERLRAIEDLRFFDGRPYPNGIEPFPRVLVGQGFFPGGDGLWRDEDPSMLRQPSPYPFPRGGVMFLGNDFGSLSGFQRLKLHENPPTWRNLRRRLERAGISGQVGFYTNAYLGLRSDRDALADPIQHRRYDEVCADFLAFQIATQAPGLIVVLGDRPASLLRTVLNSALTLTGVCWTGVHEGRALRTLVMSHPYSDLGKSDQAKQAEAELLRKACEGLSLD